MSAKMLVILEGLPERVQETADVLDRAFPGVMNWQGFAVAGQDFVVRLKGEAVTQNKSLSPFHLTDQAPALSRPWKVSSVVGGTLPKHGRFCASLSKSLAGTSEPADELPCVETDCKVEPSWRKTSDVAAHNAMLLDA